MDRVIMCIKKITNKNKKPNKFYQKEITENGMGASQDYIPSLNEL